MISPVLFSSASNEWPTPLDFFEILDDEFSFSLDPCCTHESAKTSRHFTEEDDGLSQDWEGSVVFMNPPYGRQIGKWIEKAFLEGKKEKTVVVCLIPSRTDTRYWHEFVMRAKEIRLVRGRLKFGDGKGSAPFPSAVVVFDGDHETPTLSAISRGRSTSF